MDLSRVEFMDSEILKVLIEAHNGLLADHAGEMRTYPDCKSAVEDNREEP